MPGTDELRRLDNLKTWIAQHSSIKQNRQILMTSRGKQVKLQTLLTEVFLSLMRYLKVGRTLTESQKEIFVYDRDLLAASPDGSSGKVAPSTVVPEPFIPLDPPDAVADERNLQAWQKLFKNRRIWTIDLSKNCKEMGKQVLKHDAEATVIQRATAIAVENIKQHVAMLHQKYEDTMGWADDALRDHAMLLDKWETSLARLSAIKAKPQLRKFVNQNSARLEKPLPADPEGFTLQHLVDVGEIRSAAAKAKAVSQRLRRDVSSLNLAYEEITKNSTDMIENFSQTFTSPVNDIAYTSTGLIEETEAIVKKISSDYENSLTYPDTTKSITAISKTALLHSRNFLPSLLDTTADLDQLLRSTIQRKNHISGSAISYMQRISQIESSLANIQPRLQALDIGDDAGAVFDLIGFVDALPLIYGSLIIELVRRKEWSEKMTADSSTLAEEMAAHKEEEERRRKKWLKSVADFLTSDSLNSKAMGIEVNLKPHEQTLPDVSREDISDYITNLQDLGAYDEILKGLIEMRENLDAPSKQQVRRTNAFKNGSIHEASFGRNSLLLRGDDDLLRSLQSDKTKLEDRLKGSESRIRKLEDLLHRQSQIARPTSGHSLGPGSGQGIQRHSTSPVLNHVSSSPKAQDNLSRRSSVSSRRFSGNYGVEEKALAQRIVRLEADLMAERAKSAQLQESNSTQARLHDDLRRQVGEAASTQKDLMDNFKARQHEFDAERRNLQEEKEILEKELDRLASSHDNARIGFDDRARELDEELERVRRESAEEVQKAQGQIDFLKNDYTMQREKANKLERQIQQQEQERADLENKLSALESDIKDRDNIQEDYQRALQTSHLHLAAEEFGSQRFDLLVKAIELLAEKSANHVNELKQTLERLRTENTLLENKRQAQDEEISNLTDCLAQGEQEILSMRTDMAAHNALRSSLQNELEGQRKELQDLRSKIASGETGSETLKARLVEEENKVHSITSELASTTARAELLGKALNEKTAYIESIQASHSAADSRSDVRARRAQELSTMLFSQVNRLVRLLEQIGFTVTKGENGMTVQRTPKTSSTSTLLIDQSQSMGRSLSSPLPTKSEEPTAPKYIHWALSPTIIDENQSYDAFMREIHSFDLTTFTEAITKRIKESDHTARKWQREAKAYRDKAHRFALEAHEKIAYRSFKDGDLALFLPTRNQATRPWAAFNVGAPHYFLREQDSHRLQSRDWLLARISKVEERVVDLSKSINGVRPPSSQGQRRNSLASTSDGGASIDDENPFELSDGLRWYLLDAVEEKPGAPSTPGLGKSTVASANVAASGNIGRKRPEEGNMVSRTLAKSLDSRRGSAGSRKSLVGASTSPVVAAGSIPEDTVEAGGAGAVAEVAKVQDDGKPVQSTGPFEAEVRQDLLWGP